jgi:hypothetical protein
MWFDGFRCAKCRFRKGNRFFSTPQFSLRRCIHARSSLGLVFHPRAAACWELNHPIRDGALAIHRMQWTCHVRRSGSGNSNSVLNGRSHGGKVPF